MYLFGSKNSFGQIAGVASVVLITFAIRKARLRRRLVFLALAIALAFMAMLMQCRTALLALFAAIIVQLCCAGKKRMLIVVGFCAIFAFCLSPTLQTYISHALFLDKYQDADLNAFSSGRLELWAAALDRTSENPMLGIGHYYVDCFYINTYANVGILGSLFVFPLWGIRVVRNIKYGLSIRHELGSLEWLRITSLALTAFYLVESVLEGFPPFGPGASSFLFWMLSGFLDAASERDTCMNGVVDKEKTTIPLHQIGAVKRRASSRLVLLFHILRWVSSRLLGSSTLRGWSPVSELTTTVFIRLRFPSSTSSCSILG